MTQNNLARMSREDLIELTLQIYGQNVKLQAEIEALKLKMEKGWKPPTDSANNR
jgi:hypothetical protein